MNKVVWIPEVRGLGGLYAGCRRRPVGIETPPVRVEFTTQDPYVAMHFDNQADCQAWCVGDHDFPFEPVEHMFTTT